MSALTLVLTLLAQLIPQITGDIGIIQTIINTLTSIVPLIIKEAQDIYPMIKNIIAALSENPGTTADQLTALKALDKQADDAFDLASQPQPGDPDYVAPTT